MSSCTIQGKAASVKELHWPLFKIQPDPHYFERMIWFHLNVVNTHIKGMFTAGYDDNFWINRIVIPKSGAILLLQMPLIFILPGR